MLVLVVIFYKIISDPTQEIKKTLLSKHPNRFLSPAADLWNRIILKVKITILFLRIIFNIALGQLRGQKCNAILT